MIDTGAAWQCMRTSAHMRLPAHFPYRVVMLHLCQFRTAECRVHWVVVFYMAILEATAGSDKKQRLWTTENRRNDNLR